MERKKAFSRLIRYQTNHHRKSGRIKQLKNLIRSNHEKKFEIKTLSKKSPLHLPAVYLLLPAIIIEDYKLFFASYILILAAHGIPVKLESAQGDIFWMTILFGNRSSSSITTSVIFRHFF